MSPPKSQDLARRIARAQAYSYWEQNLVDGRLAAIARLLEWMQPLTGRRVLDAACGEGDLARRLASRGALVVGCDPDAEAIAEARSTAADLDFRCADAEDVLAARRFDDVVFWELLEGLNDEHTSRLFAALESAGPDRLFVALRLQPGWTRLLPSYPGAELPTADPVQVLRSLHLATDIRFHRQETITRRNSALHLLELHRFVPVDPDVD